MKYLFIIDTKPTRSILDCLNFRILFILLTIISLILSIVNIFIFPKAILLIIFYILSFLTLIVMIVITVFAFVNSRKVAGVLLIVHTGLLLVLAINYIVLFILEGIYYINVRDFYSRHGIDLPLGRFIGFYLYLGIFVLYNFFVNYIFNAFEKHYDDLMGNTITQDLVDPRNTSFEIRKI